MPFGWSELVDLFNSHLGDYGPMGVQVLKIIWINILLSGDNAVVIALACRALPRRQRVWGIILGAGAAVALRVVFTVGLQYVLEIPALRLVGGLLLLWIAIKLLEQDEANEDSVESSDTLWGAVRTVAIADVVMSLDNVLAIAVVAEGHLGLVIFGIALSMPIVVFGSALLAALMNKFTWIIWVGGGVLGYYAGKLICEDPVVRRVLGEYAEVCAESVPLILGAGIAAIGWGFEQGRKRRARKHAHHHRAA